MQMIVDLIQDFGILSLSIAVALLALKHKR